MKIVDRSIFIAIAIGVWALAIRPYVIEAHNKHCTISSARGYGYVDNKNVTISEGFYEAYEGKLNNGAGTINKISGDALCY